ncbi:alpha/beta hydrolase [Sphingomonas immobilis]|uniref:Alpha/beta hydrolase n=1 Tax=Sphingomonas immobilis TaxID=3063997 RepID=A0ABT8ZTY7_9SPHN|nr:alpha/beta hydrolase [Sphingomonas sp. CA1-15]MDO7841032.1 alpha/beta hydrolase [Sphingomonas sp. CA1-15]
MLKGIAIGLLLVLLAVAAVIGFVMMRLSPPGQLTFLDAVMGGGRGAARPGTALPFGTHGQSLDVWRPAGPVQKRPVVVFFYGGGWAMGSREAYGFAARAFARQGFVVVVPDYRKVPDVRFPAFVQDGAEAVAWTRAHVAEYGGDPERIALAGHSAGSHIAALLALDRRYGVADDVKAVVGLSGPYDFYPWTSPRAIAAFEGTADKPSTQPITYARADAPPMLLVTSTGDTEVEPKNAINLTKRLKALGAKVAFRDYPGLSHEQVVMALSVPFRGKGPVLADASAFLHEHLDQ